MFLDAEDWKSVRIVNPAGITVFEASGKGPYALPQRGLSEMFFEGAEPSLDEVPLASLLALFPEGKYRFIGVTSEGAQLTGYQVIVDPFQVTLPASATQVTLPREFADTLAAGSHGFEVLAIDASGNQTITAGSFETP